MALGRRRSIGAEDFIETARLVQIAKGSLLRVRSTIRFLCGQPANDAKEVGLADKQRSHFWGRALVACDGFVAGRAFPALVCAQDHKDRLERCG